MLKCFPPILCKLVAFINDITNNYFCPSNVKMFKWLLKFKTNSLRILPLPYNSLFSFHTL